MSQELQTKETEEVETTPAPDELAAVTAELTAEREAKATLETDLAAKDLALEALTLQLTAAQGDLTTVTASLDEASQTHAQAVAIADAVRATLAGEAKNVRVPAGAPTRVINLDGLTPKEKIALGLQQQKGGAG